MSAKFPRGGANPFSAIRLVWVTSNRYFDVCTNFALSASSQSENNQCLKIQVTRTPFQNFGFCLTVFHISTLFMLETKRYCNNDQNQSLKRCERKVGEIGLEVCFSPRIIFAAVCSKFVLVCIIGRYAGIKWRIHVINTHVDYTMNS